MTTDYDYLSNKIKIAMKYAETVCRALYNQSIKKLISAAFHNYYCLENGIL